MNVTITISCDDGQTRQIAGALRHGVTFQRVVVVLVRLAALALQPVGQRWAATHARKPLTSHVDALLD